eukprot:scaffold78327_cov21-Tisochrysis_lutea.AAC.1
MTPWPWVSSSPLLMQRNFVGISIADEHGAPVLCFSYAALVGRKGKATKLVYHLEYLLRKEVIMENNGKAPHRHKGSIL